MSEKFVSEKFGSACGWPAIFRFMTKPRTGYAPSMTFSAKGESAIPGWYVRILHFSSPKASIDTGESTNENETVGFRIPLLDGGLLLV